MVRGANIPTVLACLPLALLAGCLSGPAVSAAGVAGAAPAPAVFLRAGEAAPQPPADSWWTGLNDAELSRLIAAGLASAPRVAAAEARLREARAGLVRARADGLPVLGATALAARADLPGTSAGTAGLAGSLFAVGFDAQWEADLWGGARRSVAIGRAGVAEADAGLADTRVQLAAEIARTYVQLRELEGATALLERRAMLEGQFAELTAQRVRGGTVPAQALEAVRQHGLATRAEREDVRSRLVLVRDALAVLTGRPPGELDGLAPGPVPLPPARVDVGDPAGLLARRPDLRAAEQRLLAADAGIGLAEARRLPSLSLVGLIGLGGNSLESLVSDGNVASLVVPQVNWSFLDFGRRLADVRAARARRDAAVADYRETLLGVLLDAEQALNRFGTARNQLAISVELASSARRAAALEATRAAAGTIGRGDAVESELRVIAADLAVSRDCAALTAAYVALAKALGLGWQDSAAAPVKP